ncbi:response regulator transcription factor [Pseudooceanicola algae]|uniref:Cell cycle response regulator CtrA n=1 Tax=Pseudooceanicola algae TaxID=1537215 RepID=A0A418SJC7_9RHOB|nr:response regulator transcription factor [Pseudooceanicola algae]QPM91859.1 Cell cycle response regulator CtrA [Pseudooceanicola algae]
MRLLVTDTTWNIAGLAHNLGKEGFYISEAANAEETLEFAASAEIDAILVDPDMPDMPAVKLVARLRMAHPHLVICVVSRRNTDEIRAPFLIAGADDVIEWPDRTQEIAARLRAFVRRAAGFALPVLETGGLRLDLGQMKLHYEEMPIHLTRVEYEMIEMLMLRNGRIVTRDQIMMQIYAWEDEPDPKIIDVYTCRIRAKLAAIGAPDDLIVTCFGQGLRIPYLVEPPRKTEAA